MQTVDVGEIRERVYRVPDAQRGFVVRPGIGCGPTSILGDELHEQRGRRVRERGVACNDVGRPQLRDRTVAHRRIERAERAAERDEFPVAETAVGAEERRSQVPCLVEQRARDAVGLDALTLRPRSDNGCQPLDEFFDGRRERIAHRPIVARSRRWLGGPVGAEREQ